MHGCALGFYCARHTCCKQLRAERVKAEGVGYYSGYKGWKERSLGGRKGGKRRVYNTNREGKGRQDSSIMAHETGK
jgi:hypothetical protein